VDADTIAYESDVDGNFDIHTVGATDASESVLVPHHVAAAAWSFDATGVAYVTDAYGELALCYQDLLLDTSVCYADATPELAGARDPSFSPDGTRLYFASDLDGDYDIYAATLDGTWSVENLTATSAANETQPSLSPDGTMLAFVSDRGLSGTRGIYVFDY
jgi:Tol biopolymer transport system component